MPSLAHTMSLTFSAMARAVVAGVQEPAGTVHDPAVHDIGKALHRGEGDEKDQDGQQDRHGPDIGKSGRWRDP